MDLCAFMIPLTYTCLSGLEDGDLIRKKECIEYMCRQNFESHLKKQYCIYSFQIESILMQYLIVPIHTTSTYFNLCRIIT